MTKIIKMNSARHMVITPKARVSFPCLFTPRSFGDDPELKKSYSVDLIFDSKTALETDYVGQKKQTPSIKKVIFNAKKDQWGADKDKWPKFNYPVLKDGNEQVDKEGVVRDGYKDKLFITARCGEKFPPKIIGRDGKALDESSFYGGCYAIGHLVARPYAVGKNLGIRFLLMGLQKVADGERFGGVDADVFDEVEQEESEETVDADF